MSVDSTFLKRWIEIWALRLIRKLARWSFLLNVINVTVVLFQMLFEHHRQEHSKSDVIIILPMFTVDLALLAVLTCISQAI